MAIIPSVGIELVTMESWAPLIVSKSNLTIILGGLRIDSNSRSGGMYFLLGGKGIELTARRSIYTRLPFMSCSTLSMDTKGPKQMEVPLSIHDTTSSLSLGLHTYHM